MKVEIHRWLIIFAHSSNSIYLNINIAVCLLWIDDNWINEVNIGNWKIESLIIQMKHIAAYALLVLGGNDAPSKSMDILNMQQTRMLRSFLRKSELPPKKKSLMLLWEHWRERNSMRYDITLYNSQPTSLQLFIMHHTYFLIAYWIRTQKTCHSLRRPICRPSSSSSRSKGSSKGRTKERRRRRCWRNGRPFRWWLLIP
jgi:hypothetical protein